MYKSHAKRNEYSLARKNRIRDEFFDGKSCFRCKVPDKKLRLWRIDQKYKIPNSIWSMAKQKRNEELKHYTAVCFDCYGKHKE